MAFPALKKKKPGGGGRRVREKREEGFSYGVRKNLATGMNFIPLTSSILPSLSWGFDVLV